MMKNKRHDNKIDMFFYSGLTLFFLFGAFLRLYGWTQQMLLDDEWHAINFVIGKNWVEVFIKQGMGANSIPVNIYSWLLLHVVGWSEPLLRLPSMLAGLVALIVLPLLAARLFGRAVALVFASLLSVAPLLIFYSRIARPYAPVMLFASASMMLTLLWLKEWRRRYVLLSGLSGAIAIYYHLYAAIPVCIPLFVALVWLLYRCRFNLPCAAPAALKDLFLAIGIIVLLDGIFVAIPTIINPWWMNKQIHNMDHATMGTLYRFVELVSGTYLLMTKMLMLLLFASGLVATLRNSRIIFLALIAPMALFALIMSTTTQDGSHAAIQVARYGIAFIPLILLVCAVGGVNMFRRLAVHIPNRYLMPTATVVALLIWAMLLVGSPLLATYRFPNNFTSHSSFQYQYEPMNWQRSRERDLVPGYSVSEYDISPLYRTRNVLATIPGIIEFPMVIGDHYNLLYYYQHFHGRPVVAGYLSGVALTTMPVMDEFVYGNSPIDNVLGRLSPTDRGGVKWNTMVDLLDLSRVRSQYAGWLLVAHYDGVVPVTPAVIKGLSRQYGIPQYQDNNIIAWIVR